MPDENGETRRERNKRFGKKDGEPDFSLSPECLYIWSWYWTISARVRRVRDGVAEPITPAVFLGWCEASDTIISPVEYGILCAMDDVFCEEMNLELKAFQDRIAAKNNPDTKPIRRRK